MGGDGREIRFRERSLIEGSESMAGWGLSVKPVSDGAAFNRFLCLSQLWYVMASNTWANTLEILFAPKVKTGV